MVELEPRLDLHHAVMDHADHWDHPCQLWMRAVDESLDQVDHLGTLSMKLGVPMIPWNQINNNCRDLVFCIPPTISMCSSSDKASSSPPLPTVLTAPSGSMLSSRFTSIAKSRSNGQAVPQIPRVDGGGTHHFDESKTKEAVTLLKSLEAYAAVVKVSNSCKLCAGKGKPRNCRHHQHCGPLVVYNKDKGIMKAFRNIVVLRLSTSRDSTSSRSGGHLGCFVIWTEGAFSALSSVFSTLDQVSAQKKDYILLATKITNPDVTGLINSNEIQSEHLEKKDAKKPKAPKAARKEFLGNLFAP
ncbi:hypothetical protein NP233_g11905 [Leucocoprinus birnbaumii]|uniref:Uncharacterized protein n=1 Tax=Leucocoprinus birnbaumii TaxID=56174 RepID=A0AAD5YNI6_9AGAR|nr:hypothetical protein NP233_g11905 [Leucocoprinus birnbaumii]